MELADILNELPRLSAGLVMLTMAIWVLATDFWWKTGRMFAIYMVLRGLLNLVLPFSDEGGAPKNLDGFTLYGQFLYNALPFAGVAFALRYRDPTGKHRSTNITLGILLVAVLVLELIYLIDPTWGFRRHGHDFAFLRLTISLTFASYAAIAILLYLASLKATGLHARGLLIASASSALFPLYAGFTDPLRALMRNGQDWPADEILYWGIEAAAGLSMVWLFGALVRHNHYRTAGLFGVVAASAVMVSIPVQTEPIKDVRDALNGLYTLAMPLGIGYALTRHRLFHMDLVLKWSVAHALVVAIFVAIFAVVQSTAGELVNQTFGILLALLASVIGLFFLSQFQDFGDAIARRLVPSQDITEMTDAEKRDAYRSQAALVAEQGGGRRSALHNLGRQMGLSKQDMAELEANLLASETLATPQK